MAHDACEPDFAAEQGGELAADRKTQAGAAVLSARAGVSLLEGFEDQSLFFRRDANACVRHFDRHGSWHEPKDGVLSGPPARDVLHPHLDLALRRELERIRQQVLEDLLKPLGIARERPRERVVDLDLEREALRLGQMM